MHNRNDRREKPPRATQKLSAGEFLRGLIVLSTIIFCTVCFTKAYRLNRETEATNAQSKQINDSVAATVDRISANAK
jgi:hypothetical protein